MNRLYYGINKVLDEKLFIPFERLFLGDSLILDITYYKTSFKIEMSSK